MNDSLSERYQNAGSAAVSSEWDKCTPYFVRGERCIMHHALCNA